MDISQFIFAFLIILFGSLVQASSGLGAGFIIVPILALININFIPSPILIASLALTIIMTIQGRKNIDRKNLSYILFGITLGAAAAGLFILTVPNFKLELLIGIFIAALVLLSTRKIKISVTKANSLLAGATAGFIGTTAAVGGPILALLYQNQKGPVIRSTLALIYLLATLIMLTALSFTGKLAITDLTTGLFLTPGFIIGFLLARKLAAYLDRGHSRVAILLISSVSATILIIRGISH